MFEQTGHRSHAADPATDGQGKISVDPPSSGAGGTATPKPVLDPQALVHLAQSSRDVFERCVDIALTITCATTVLALLHRSGPERLEVVAAAGNRAAEAVGRSVPQGQGLSWQVFAHRHAVHVPQVQHHPAARYVAGTPLPGMYVGVPLVDPDGQVFGVLSADTTQSNGILDRHDLDALALLAQAAGVAYARLLALEEARRSARRFERVARLSSDLELVTDPAEIARHALHSLLDVSDFTGAAMFVLQDDGSLRREVLVVRDGVDRAPFETREPVEPSGMLRAVLASRATVVQDDPAWPHTDGREAGVIRPALATPLRSQGEVIGALTLVGAQATPGDLPDLTVLLELVAARTERAIERVRGQQRERDLREAALRSMGRVLEYRDDETSGHTDRVTALAVRLGEALGLHGDDLRALRWGAYLHDIGKVAVGDEILRKSGPLTRSERLVMQEHVVTGDTMLRDEAFVPRAVREIVRHHHERWDGTGYPDRLAGNDIPLLARIFSVVDVYDALTSERPYKRAWTPEAARAELARCAGGQFDPWVVQAFLERT